MNNEQARWSENAVSATKEALDEFAALPAGDSLALKNIDGRFATMSIENWLAKRARIVDRSTGEETSFADTDELIRAGWVID
ncbi:hypothetical protein JDN40_04525 [Rhodomicrobium vannielii ATCC 17100]|uniref:hypothetical protein n=1 Tax=Rhodomicrobium vannielii TaxID=1069 RepID=UPI0019193065|nr:hypothetical protein [Rhodomicrobium vannielii]MBJ7533370.1 hypothetical protein [Rhodomicrobium vannielii ATCC 17100]